MTPSLAGKRVLLGLSGSIAAYKACELARELMREGAEVQAVLTPAAARFVTPLSFTALTGRAAYVSDLELDPSAGGASDVYAHLNLTRDIDLFIVAPASADALSQLASGGAASLLACCYLSNRAPVLIAPAMNVRMWTHGAVQSNIKTLQARGDRIVGPAGGSLACGDEGEGRLAETADILAAAQELISAGGPAMRPGPEPGHNGKRGLHGRRVVVTGGGTREYLDPVRFITNASSGKLAIETCTALLDFGASVELVHTGVDLAASLAERLCAVQEVRTGFDLQSALSRAMQSADALVMFAAVADYAPAHYVPSKRKKDGQAWEIELTQTPDILASLTRGKRPGQVFCGVSLEDSDWLARAQQKAMAKGMDLCLAVELAADLPFGPATMHCALVDATSVLVPGQQASKAQAAAWIAAHLATALDREHSAANCTQTHSTVPQEA